ncbi:MAG TPA: sarcosine oxidase subunit gamma family protein [Hyphomicrobiaceae bacterium]|nr:sarcosine oxidase subunit gamma family protein [Hyphomicrobiaceae bacterium]
MLETRHAPRRQALNAPLVAEADSSATISVRPVQPAARFSLRLDPPVAQSLATIAGFRLDLPINRCAASGERMAARLGPNEWLLLAPAADEEATAGQIEAALTGRFYSLVNIGHRDTAVTVSGRYAADVLSAGCPLDLAEIAFPAGSATRTLLGKAEIVLTRVHQAPTYHVECGRSFGRYVHDFLLEACREFENPTR